MHVHHAAQRGIELNLWYSVKVKIEKCCENIIYRKHIHSYPDGIWYLKGPMS